MSEVKIKDGYLYKKSRSQTWQRRYFETAGPFLTYYRVKPTSSNRKLLACLNMQAVGEIALVNVAADNEPEKYDGTFSLELNRCIYSLRAANKEEAEDWIKELKAMKERALPPESPPNYQQDQQQQQQQTPPPKDSVKKEDSSQQNQKLITKEAPNGRWIKNGRSSLCCC